VATGAQLLVTKTRMPRLPSTLVARPRLAARLKDALRHRLVLLSAPAGYGKTTVLAATLSDFPAPVGWVSLDAGDDDPGGFWMYVVSALQSVESDMCRPILDALQSPEPPPLKWLMTSLVNSISGYGGDFILVLDDYHAIESPAIHEGVGFLCERLPPQAHLVIASRADPPLPLARWRAKGGMAELRADDLAFTPEEAADFFESFTGIALEARDLATLESRTEGWIAGLKMAALSLRGTTDISRRITGLSGSNRHILDYLSEEVLDRLPLEVRQFLVDTSILDRLSGPLCDAVTGRNDGRAMLAGLESANLFISPLDDERRWYHCHQLFADILRGRLAGSEPAHVAGLHRRASEWCGREGFAEEAIDHSLRGGDTARAVGLLEEAAPLMLGRGQSARLMEYLSHIPETVVADSPWLCIGFAWAALGTNRHEDLARMLSRAVEGLSGSPDRLSAGSRANLQRIKGHLLSIQSFLARAQGDLPRAIALSEDADRELPDRDAGDLLVRAVNSLNLAAAYQGTGEISRAIPFLEGLIAAGRKGGYSYAVLSARACLAEIEMQLSRLDSAAELCREDIEEGVRPGGTCPMPGAALAYVVQGQLDYERNDLEGAAAHLRQGITLGEISANWEPVLKGCLQMARVVQAKGDEKSAMECIRRAEDVGPWVVIPPEAHWIAAAKARLSPDSAAALEWARQQEQTLPLSGLPDYRQEYPYLTLVRLKIAAGECRNLPQYLEQLIRAAARQGRNAVVIEARVLKALALDRLGDAAQAGKNLEDALSLAGPAGYARVFLDEGAPLAGLLRRIGPQSAQFEYASRLLGMMPVQPLVGRSGKPSGSAGLVEDLSEREREVLGLIAAGKSSKEIAFELFLAAGTVKKHTSNIFGKLGVESRTQAVARARDLGIL
jgi:LuxR family maltose regulon positive regulatory protein